MSKYKLINDIIDMSTSTKWDIAKKEWNVVDIYEEKYLTCLCGHHPIAEIIVIQNKINGNEVIIGNCCINKFFNDTSYNKIFKAIKQNKINSAMIEIAYNKQVINDWEYEFLMDVWRKHSLTSKQIKYYEELSSRIIKSFKSGKCRKSETEREIDELFEECDCSA